MKDELQYGSFPIVIDSTMINDFRRCPQMFYERYIACLRQAGENVDLMFGGAIAKAIEVTRRAAFFGGFPAEEAVARGGRAAIRYWGDFLEPQGHKKNLRNLLLAHKEYFDTWPLHEPPWPKYTDAIEFTFSLPLPINHPITNAPLLYGGRFDMLGTDREGMTYPVDEKTTGSPFFHKTRGWNLWGQFIGYTWACKKLGYVDVDKVYVRGIYVNSTSNDFKHEFVQYTDAVITRWYDDLLEDVERMIWMYQREKFRRVYGFACKVYNICPYLDLCEATKREDWINSYQKVEQWNPLNVSGGEL